MGILFSRPGRDSSLLPAQAYPAGSAVSANSSAIAPYLGINTGLYRDISFDELPQIPFEWMVSPSEVTGTCPSSSQILTTFGVTEAVIVALTPLVAYRPFVHWISRGYFGRRVEKSAMLTWTIVFASQLLANATIAGLIGNTPGYGHLNMLHIFTLFLGRPRFSFVILALLRSLVGIKRKRAMEKTNIVKKKVDNLVEYPYTDSYIATAISELLVLIITAIFTNVTWNRIPSKLKAREYMSDMIQYTASAPGIYFLCILAFVPVYKRYGDALPLEGRRYTDGRQWRVSVAPDGQATIGVKKRKPKFVLIKRIASAAAAGLLMGYVILVQWSYWTRFLELPGVLFCPPKLMEQGIIWAVFTLFGTLVGAAA